MPTNSYRARKLLKSGRTRVYSHSPLFAIMLSDREGGAVQQVEYKCDTGYQHIGISVCTEKQELVSAQFDMLPDEKKRHSDSRKLRRSRRNRLRYRKPRFNNRRGKIVSDGFAPSIRNKRNLHIRLFEQFAKLLPVKEAVFEMGQFDTQVLKAMAEGKPLPHGTDYQQGEQYCHDTLREAVFSRDEYKCLVCGKGIGEGRILCIHHLGYLKGDRSNRMSNLATVCTNCHTARNHKPGGRLYDLKPKLKSFAGATFMTAVRWDMLNKLKAVRPDINFRITYGAATKRQRRSLGLDKSHANDAYSMGSFHPVRRTVMLYFAKRRRNNRILEKFYDARYRDSRDGSIKTGSQLSCGRTNRREGRHTDKDERVYRAHKISPGRRSIRRQRYYIQPGDRIVAEGRRCVAVGTHCNGARVMVSTGKSVSVKKLYLLYHVGGWMLHNN